MSSFKQTIQVDGRKYSSLIEIVLSDICFKYVSYKGNSITLSVPYRRFEKLLNADASVPSMNYTDIVEVRRPIPLFTNPPSLNYRTFEYNATIKRIKDTICIKIADETLKVSAIDMLLKLTASNSK